MPRLYVARRATRKGLYLPTPSKKKNQSLLFFLPKCDPGQLDELVRKQLGDLGITNEAEVQSIIARAEVEYEKEVKLAETKKELKRLREIRANGGTLIKVGNKKWRQGYYPAVKRFEGGK